MFCSAMQYDMPFPAVPGHSASAALSVPGRHGMPVRGELSGSAGLQPSVRRKGRSSSRYPEDFPVSTARARDGLPACVADLSCFILKMAARMLCHALSPVPDLDHRLTSFQGQPLTDQFMGNGVPVACIFNMVIRSHFHCPELGIFIGGERCQHRRFFLREYKRFNGLRRQRFWQGPWR